MDVEHKLCYLSTLHRAFNIPLIYRRDNAKYTFQPFEVESEEND